MRLEHADYIRLVKGAYQKKRANNELSPLLLHSTPANIRRECMNVYKERYDKKDESVLRAFFGPAEQGRKFLTAMEDFPINKLKPLNSYLKSNGEKSINDRNLELLAWLIDFPIRPYSFGREVQLSEEELGLLKYNPEKKHLHEGDGQEKNPIAEILPEEREEISGKSGEESSTPPTTISNKGRVMAAYKRAAVIFLALVIGTAGLYAIWQHSGDSPAKMGDTVTGCMYWDNDHYEKLPCNEDAKGRLLLPLDEEKRKNFKKITREDTITEKSVGVIYYLKTAAKLEYFTSSGNHPVFITSRLKPLSRYMFDEHLRKKDTATADSLKNSTGVHNLKKDGNISRTTLQASGTCLGITKKGTRCKRKAKLNGYCWQHRG